MRVKKRLPAMLAGILAAALSLAPSASSAFADGEESTIDASRKGSVTISYVDEADAASGGKSASPVVGAEFTLYKIASIEDMLYSSVSQQEYIPEGEASDQSDAELPDVSDTSGEELDAAATSETSGVSSIEEETAGDTYNNVDTFVIGSGYVALMNDIAYSNEDGVSAATVASVQKAYENVVPAGGAIYKVVTDTNGVAKAVDMEHGVYLVVETAPAKEHFASAPFVLSTPVTSEDGTHWVYDREAFPKALPAGDLVISKTVAGNAGDTTKDFHFNVTFDFSGSYKDNPPTSYHYTKSDKTEGQIKSGDTIALKHGQSVTIDTIPIGTKYVVKEVEADQDGYKTTVENSSSASVISRSAQAKVAFTNTKTVTPVTPTSSTGIIQTSDTLIPIVLAGCGVAVALIVILIVMRKSKGKGDKK